MNSESNIAHKLIIKRNEKRRLIFDIIEKEHQRQLKGIELIASENFVSDQVMQAMVLALPTSMLKGIPASATMAVAKW